MWRLHERVLGTETFACVGNELRLSLPATDGASILVKYLVKIPVGDFDISIDITECISTAESRGFFYISDRNIHNTIRLNVNDLGGGNVDVNLARKLNNDYTSIFTVSDIGVIASIKLRLKLVGTTFYGYYDKGEGWILVNKYTSATLADGRLDRIMLSAIEDGDAAVTMDFDNLEFNGNLCPLGDQWTTTTTSSTTCSTCSTLSTFSTEPPP